jgi:hypothetical protein
VLAQQSEKLAAAVVLLVHLVLGKTEETHLIPLGAVLPEEAEEPMAVLLLLVATQLAQQLGREAQVMVGQEVARLRLHQLMLETDQTAVAAVAEKILTARF